MTMPDAVRLHARVYGEVQGVGFRYSAQREASTLELGGLVRNRWDGTVEVVAEGERQAVERFLSWLQIGPTGARVERVDVQWEKPSGEFRRFEVVF